jgi:hypothetical protein
MTALATESDVNRSALRPDETECHHRAERALKLLVGSPDDTAIRIDSNPNPMYVTVEDGDLTFWAYDYTWRCQQEVAIEDAFGRFTTVVDQLHGYANDGYGIGTVAKERMNTGKKPRATGLEDF